MKFFSSPRFWLLAALLLLPFMVNNDSLWLDEGDTAMYVLQPDFHAWCDRLVHDGQADCQMPLALPLFRAQLRPPDRRERRFALCDRRRRRRH